MWSSHWKGSVPCTLLCLWNNEVQAMTRAGGYWAKAGSVNHQTIIHVLGAASIQWLVNVEECLKYDSFRDAKPVEVHEQSMGTLIAYACIKLYIYIRCWACRVNIAKELSSLNTQMDRLTQKVIRQFLVNISSKFYEESVCFQLPVLWSSTSNQCKSCSKRWTPELVLVGACWRFVIRVLPLSSCLWPALMKSFKFRYSSLSIMDVWWIWSALWDQDNS